MGYESVSPDRIRVLLVTLEATTTNESLARLADAIRLFHHVRAVAEVIEGEHHA